MKTYIQIGANVGNDLFQRRMESLVEKSRIILVEPILGLIPSLSSNYQSLAEKHDVIVVNAGIVADKDLSIKKLSKYSHVDGHLVQECSSIISRKSLPSFLVQDKDYFEFVPSTFDDLCNHHGIVDIENLYIDTEGYDYTILDAIDFNKYNIKKIECEVWFFDEDSLIANEIKTGSLFFEHTIKPKMEKLYSITEDLHEGCRTHVFTIK